MAKKKAQEPVELPVLDELSDFTNVKVTPAMLSKAHADVVVLEEQIKALEKQKDEKYSIRLLLNLFYEQQKPISAPQVALLRQMAAKRASDGPESNLTLPRGKRDSLRALERIGFCRYTVSGFHDSLKAWITTRGLQKLAQIDAKG